MNLESELFTLQDSNSKLVAALHEANANVEQWKKQLSAYQEETERLRDQVGPHLNQHLSFSRLLPIPNLSLSLASVQPSGQNQGYSYSGKKNEALSSAGGFNQER